jgi:hypothetical protein
MNIMLVAVSERTRRSDYAGPGRHQTQYTGQFFLEGILLTLLSGLIGMGLAGGLMALLGLQQDRQDLILPSWCPRPRFWRLDA